MVCPKESLKHIKEKMEENVCPKDELETHYKRKLEENVVQKRA